MEWSNIRYLMKLVSNSGCVYTARVHTVTNGNYLHKDAICREDLSLYFQGWFSKAEFQGKEAENWQNVNEETETG